MNVNKYGTFELQWHNYNISPAKYDLECANVDDMDYHKYHHH